MNPMIASSRLFRRIDTTARRENGVSYYEHYVGDFAVAVGRVVEIGFTDADAGALARLLIALTGDVRRTILTFYPYLHDRWQSISGTSGTTLHHRSFQRRSIFGLYRATHPRVVGFAHSEGKLAEVLHWAWTLPGLDSIVIVDAAMDELQRLVALFQDDREDTAANDVKLILEYPLVASRAVAGRHLRLSSRTVSGDDLRRTCDRIRESPA